MAVNICFFGYKLFLHKNETNKRMNEREKKTNKKSFLAKILCFLSVNIYTVDDYNYVDDDDNNNSGGRYEDDDKHRERQRRVPFPSILPQIFFFVFLSFRKFTISESNSFSFISFFFVFLQFKCQNIFFFLLSYKTIPPISIRPSYTLFHCLISSSSIVIYFMMKKMR